jgi:hypothetical protein
VQNKKKRDYKKKIHGIGKILIQIRKKRINKIKNTIKNVDKKINRL